MRRIVAAYLEPRLCREAINVGLEVVPADAIALLRAGMIGSLRYDAGRLLGEVSTLDLLAGGHLSPSLLTDEPIRPLADDPDADRRLDLFDYVRSGDHAGCLRLLGAAVARANALEAAAEVFTGWPRLARMTRLLTGDDAAAMSLLERLPLPASHDDWIELFGPLGVARIQRAKDVVLAAVERAFDGVPFPGPGHRSLFQAEAADTYRDCDQSGDHQGRWQDLPREHILQCQYALPYLAGPSLQYYLPAILSFIVREHDQRHPDHAGRWIFESTEYYLQLDLTSPSARDHDERRHRGLTRDQFAAIAAFADYYRCRPEDRAHWHELARGGAWPALG